MKTLLGVLNGQLPKLVMFDLDGTLIDSVPDLAVATDQMLVQLGRAPAGMDKVRNWVGNVAPWPMVLLSSTLALSKKPRRWQSLCRCMAQVTV